MSDEPATPPQTPPATPGPASPAAGEVPPTRAVRPIPLWVIRFAIPVMVLVAVAAVWLLLGLGVDGGKLDAIRTGGAIVVGVGGLVLLWLAMRRQRSTEQDLEQKERTHQLAERTAADTLAHQQRVAAAAERDAAEKRITELYSKSADQLGSDKAPVRLAGLLALERLAQGNPEHRQTIVNLLCAYLRMPYTLPSGLPEPSDEAALARHEHLVQEREVRLTAQRILTTHLNPGPRHDHPSDTFWPHTDLDLTGATLIDIDLRQCRIRTAQFTRTHFIGIARFEKATFTSYARFAEATFTDQADFVWTTFPGSTGFGGATFTGKASFYGATFRYHVWFGEVTFTRGVSFIDARFAGNAVFDKARFNDNVSFNQAVFNASFDKPKHDSSASTRFRYAARFSEAAFNATADFNEARFHASAKFTSARFHGPASFRMADFDGAIGVSRVVFDQGWPAELTHLKPATGPEGDSKEEPTVETSSS